MGDFVTPDISFLFKAYPCPPAPEDFCLCVLSRHWTQEDQRGDLSQLWGSEVPESSHPGPLDSSVFQGALARGRNSKICNREKRRPAICHEVENKMVRDPQAWFLSHGDTSLLCDKSKDQKPEPKDTPAQGWAAGERDLKFYSACQLDLGLAGGRGI